MIDDKKIESWYQRKNKIEIYINYKDNSKNNLWDNKSKKEILHKYWICDYCRQAIIIRDKKEKDLQDGGEFIVPASLLRRGNVKVVTHNRCLNSMIFEIEKCLEEKC